MRSMTLSAWSDGIHLIHKGCCGTVDVLVPVLLSPVGAYGRFLLLVLP